MAEIRDNPTERDIKAIRGFYAAFGEIPSNVVRRFLRCQIAGEKPTGRVRWAFRCTHGHKAMWVYGPAE